MGPGHWIWAALMPLTSHPRPAHPPPGPSPPRNTWPRHATETHRAYQWEIGHLMDGVGENTSHTHAPRIPYRLGINGTVWGFGLNRLLLLPPLTPQLSYCILLSFYLFIFPSLLLFFLCHLYPLISCFLLLLFSFFLIIQFFFLSSPSSLFLQRKLRFNRWKSAVWALAL